MATKKGLCPQGQVPDGKGGCKTLIPAKPNTTTTAKATETAEEKAERIAKEKEAAAAAEQKRVAGLSNREFKQEKKGIKRNVKVADLKAGKEGKGGKIVTAALTGLASAVGIGEGIKALFKKEKPLGPQKKGGPVKTKMKTGGIMKTKMKMGGAKKYGEGGPTNKTNTGGGIPITARAAARKVAKGKGFMDYKYPSTDAPGTGDNKGSYVKFGKDQASSPSGFKSLKGAGKSRPVRKMGGATKKK